jgi:hypothetical protein
MDGWWRMCIPAAYSPAAAAAARMTWFKMSAEWVRLRVEGGSATLKQQPFRTWTQAVLCL